MTLEIVSDYKNLISNTNKLIDISGYRNDNIAKRIGVLPKPFSIKKTEGSWKIMAAINDVEEFVMLEVLRSRKNDENLLSDEFKSWWGGHTLQK